MLILIFTVKGFFVSDSFGWVLGIFKNSQGGSSLLLLYPNLFVFVLCFCSCLGYLLCSNCFQFENVFLTKVVHLDIVNLHRMKSWQSDCQILSTYRNLFLTPAPFNSSIFIICIDFSSVWYAFCIYLIVIVGYIFDFEIYLPKTWYSKLDCIGRLYFQVSNLLDIQETNLGCSCN